MREGVDSSPWEGGQERNKIGTGKRNVWLTTVLLIVLLVSPSLKFLSYKEVRSKIPKVAPMMATLSDVTPPTAKLLLQQNCSRLSKCHKQRGCNIFMTGVKF